MDFNLIKSKKLSRYKNIKHGFFDKSEDKDKHIEKNLKKKIIFLHQVHSNKFYFIDKKSKSKKNKSDGDAIITNKKSTPIGILTADCAPVLIYDKNTNMIAAIHAGWKGAYKDIIKNVSDFMLKKGCSPDTMTAVIGPCISIKNYEVKEDLKNKFLKKDKNNNIFFKNIKNKTYFSLNKYIYSQLKNLNIKNIEIIKKDTFDVKNNFFSARRAINCNENNYGRNISIIMIN